MIRRKCWKYTLIDEMASHFVVDFANGSHRIVGHLTQQLLAELFLRQVGRVRRMVVQDALVAHVETLVSGPGQPHLAIALSTGPVLDVLVATVAKEVVSFVNNGRPVEAGRN